MLRASVEVSIHHLCTSECRAVGRKNAPSDIGGNRGPSDSSFSPMSGFQLVCAVSLDSQLELTAEAAFAIY